METLGARVDHVNNGDFGYYKDDVRTMVSQGRALRVNIEEKYCKSEAGKLINVYRNCLLA